MRHITKEKRRNTKERENDYYSIRQADDSDTDFSTATLQKSREPFASHRTA
jgi:hypothetical protein